MIRFPFFVCAGTYRNIIHCIIIIVVIAVVDAHSLIRNTSRIWSPIGIATTRSNATTTVNIGATSTTNWIANHGR